jgi:hypothetical protein
MPLMASVTVATAAAAGGGDAVDCWLLRHATATHALAAVNSSLLVSVTGASGSLCLIVLCISGLGF